MSDLFIGHFPIRLLYKHELLSDFFWRVGCNEYNRSLSSEGGYRSLTLVLQLRDIFLPTNDFPSLVCLCLGGMSLRAGASSLRPRS